MEEVFNWFIALDLRKQNGSVKCYHNKEKILYKILPFYGEKISFQHQQELRSHVEYQRNRTNPSQAIFQHLM